MKALSLFQPWATLVILGIKGWETRTWKPSGLVIGERIAIHAAKGWTSDEIECALELASLNILPPDTDLPRGAIIGTVRFTGYRPTADMHPGEIEALLGDYTPGRFAWGLADPHEYVRPIPARGALGLWDWRRAA